MRKARGVKDNADSSPQADFLSSTIQAFKPDMFRQMAEEHPRFLMDMLGSLDPAALVQVVAGDPGLLMRLTREMPPDLLRLMLEERRDLVCEMIRALDTDTLMSMLKPSDRGQPLDLQKSTGIQRIKIED